MAVGGAKLLAAVEAGAAFPSPSLAASPPSCLPAAPPPSLSLISEISDFDLLYRIASPILIFPLAGRFQSTTPNAESRIF